MKKMREHGGKVLVIFLALGLLMPMLPIFLG